MMQSPMWQIGGLGPAQHFHRYATENVPGRLLSGMERRLAGRDYLTGDPFHRRHCLIPLGSHP